MLCKTATTPSSVRESEGCIVMDGRMFLYKCPTKMCLAKKQRYFCQRQFPPVNFMSVDSHMLTALGEDDGERDRGGNCEESL